jgi:hypothetical protein
MEDPFAEFNKMLSTLGINISNEIRSIENPFDQVAAIIQNIEDLSGEKTIELKAHARDIAGLFLDLDDETDLLDKAEMIRWGNPQQDVDTDG